VADSPSRRAPAMSESDSPAHEAGRESSPAKPQHGPPLVVRILLGAASLVLLGFTFRHANIADVRRLLVHTPALWLAPLPFLIFLTFDTIGWKRLLCRIGPDVPYFRLYAVRLSSEAVGLSLPSGTVLTEAVALHLLRRNFKLAPGLVAASLAGRRLLMAFGLGMSLAASSIVGHSQLAAISRNVIGSPGLQWIGLVVGLGLMTGTVVLATMWTGSAVGQRIHHRLERIPIGALQRWLARTRETFAEMDRSMSKTLARPLHYVVLTVLIFSCVWVAEAGETYLFLSLLGAHLSFRQVFSFDSPLVLLRGLAFFVPAGLGIQDLGYAAFLNALGVANAITVGAAFVLVKRSKEIFWIAVGYLLLARQVWGTPMRSWSRP
jgi:uncharacterized membrane protein YbhN (UPF0104 family)